MMGMVYWKLFLHQHSLKNGVVKSEADAHHLAALHDNHEMLLTVFKFLDVNGSGEISLEEFRQGVHLLNRHLPPDRQLNDTEKLFRVLDKDRSGQITFEEFEQIFEVM
jgi:Ca2+-binding EF-hand superfamily protein